MRCRPPTSITPNQFELELLAGRDTKTMADALAAIDALHARGPRAILVTSLQTDETPADAIDLLASRRRRAAFAAHAQAADLGQRRGRRHRGVVLRPLSAQRIGGGGAVARGSSVFGMLERTAETGAREILLIEAQEEIVNPGACIRAERLCEARR